MGGNDPLPPISLMGPDGTPRLALRPREAAVALAVSARTLWQWTNEGLVPHIRLGKTLLYSVDGLRRWLDERATTEGGQQ